MTSPEGGILTKVRRLAGRLNPFPDAARPLFRPAPAELVLWLLFAAVTLLMVLYHEPWRDEAQGYVLVRDTTLTELILHMKFESQFLLWYLLTWFLVRLFGVTIFGLNLLHWAISCCTAFLVLRRAPFRLLTRAVLIFAVLFAFEFTVVTRHYAIGVFLLAVLMVNWRRRFEHPVLYACGIAVCASTNLPVWACLGGICAAIGYEVISRKLWSRPVIAAMLVSLFGFVLALAEIFNGHGFGSPYVSYRGNQVAGFELAKRFREMSDSVFNTVFFPLFQWGHQVPRNVKEGLGFSGLDWCLLWLLAACFLIGVLYFARRSVSALVCFLTNAFLMFSLQYVGGFHSMRHVGFLLIGTVVSCWIAAQDEGSRPLHGFAFLSRLPRWAAVTLEVVSGCAVALLLFLQAVLTPCFVWMEMKYPFSHGQAASHFIRDNIPEDVPMYCFSARSNVSVLPWLPGRRYFIFDRMELGTYSKWGRSHGLFMKDMAEEIAERLEPGQRYAVFVVAMNEDPNIIPPNMVLLYDSAQNEEPVWGPYVEEFRVYAVVREEDIELYRPRVPRNPSKFIPQGVKIREAPAGI